MSEEQYPEAKKRSAAMPQIRTITEFMEWLEQNNLHICTRTPEWSHSNFQRTMESHEKIVHRFLGIDDDKLEAERREILEGLQKVADRRE